jgi:hypothetical protein
MVIGGTFTHRNVGKGTWFGYDDRIGNQIEHVRTDQPHLLNVLDIRTYRDDYVDSDQYLVIVRLRFHIVQRDILKTPTATFKYNKERLGINEVKEECAIKLVNRIQEANEYNNLNRSVLEPAVINRPDEVIVQEKGKVRNGWFGEESTESTKIKTSLTVQ